MSLKYVRAVVCRPSSPGPMRRKPPHFPPPPAPPARMRAGAVGGLCWGYRGTLLIRKRTPPRTLPQTALGNVGGLCGCGVSGVGLARKRAGGGGSHTWEVDLLVIHETEPSDLRVQKCFDPSGLRVQSEGSDPQV